MRDNETFFLPMQAEERGSLDVYVVVHLYIFYAFVHCFLIVQTDKEQET